MDNNNNDDEDDLRHGIDVVDIDSLSTHDEVNNDTNENDENDEKQHVRWPSDPDVARIASAGELALVRPFQQLAARWVRRCLSDEEQQYLEVTGGIRILRFLRGFACDLKLAVPQYRKFLIWYKTQHVGEIRREIIANEIGCYNLPFQEKILPYLPANIHHKFDRCGSPVNIELTGLSNPKKLLASVTDEEFLRHHMFHLEVKNMLYDKLSRQQDRLVKSFAVRDIGGLGMHHASPQGFHLLNQALKMAQDNYPEMLEKCFIINTPAVFSALWKLVKPMISPVTMSRIEILGSDFQSTLFKFIDPRDVPEYWGGFCGHCHLYGTGCFPVDAHRLKRHNENGTDDSEQHDAPAGSKKGTQAKAEGRQHVSVSRASKFTVPVRVFPGERVSWKFEAADSDLRFEVGFAPVVLRSPSQSASQEEADAPLPMFSSVAADHDEKSLQTVQASCPIRSGEVVSGEYKAAAESERGYLYLTWDNSSSRLRSKNLWYSLDFTPPSQAPTTASDSEK